MDELLGAAPPAEGSNEPAESSCQSKHALLSPNLCSAEHTESCRSRCLMVMKEIKTGPERTARGKKNLPGYGERCNTPSLFMPGLKQVGPE